MTKAEIISAVGTFITAVGRVTKARHKNANDTIINAFYPTVLYDNQTTTNVITKVDDDFGYNVKIAKVGRLVNIDGFVENITESTIANEAFANITNTEFQTAVGILPYYLTATSTSGLTIFVSVNPTTLSVVGTVPIDTKFYFNGCYTTKD
jgi:hypothetical protein